MRDANIRHQDIMFDARLVNDILYRNGSTLQIQFNDFPEQDNRSPTRNTNIKHISGKHASRSSCIENCERLKSINHSNKCDQDQQTIRKKHATVSCEEEKVLIGPLRKITPAQNNSFSDFKATMEKKGNHNSNEYAAGDEVISQKLARANSTSGLKDDPLDKCKSDANEKMKYIFKTNQTVKLVSINGRNIVRPEINFCGMYGNIATNLKSNRIILDQIVQNCSSRLGLDKGD